MALVSHCPLSRRNAPGSRLARTRNVLGCLGQRTFPRTETEIAIARRDVDIAYAVDHGMRIAGRKAERGAAAEQTHNGSLLESAHCRRMLGFPQIAFGLQSPAIGASPPRHSWRV